MAYTQENRLIAVQTPLGKDVLLLTGFSGTEGLSYPFNFELDLVSENHNIAFKDIVGKNVTVSIVLADGSKRFFNGIISRFLQGSGGGEEGEDLADYTATMAPWIWLLTRTADSRIFQGLSVPDIVEKIFTEKGFLDYKFLLNDSYEKRDYCVQYRETDFNFVSRLLEEEGIFYFFTHEEKKHTMVLADAPDKHKPCPKQASARYQISAGGWEEEDFITDLEWMQEIQVGKYTLKDFNFEIPSTDLKADAPSQQSLGPGEREVYDYPGKYDKKAAGDRLANIRMQEQEAQITTITGSSDCRAFTSGDRFDLLDYYRSDMNQKSYVLTSINHGATEPVGGSGRGEAASYTNSFTCIPFEVPYRPPLVTPKPMVGGIQTAIVVGPSGETIYTDKYGRVKVQFHWDREGKKDENSSCWMRVSQLWAGAGWGAMFIPHIGHEVIVEFLDGDPDRPIITGRVYHGTNMPADALPGGKTASVIRSCGDNDIVIEDKDGDKCIHIKQACGNEIRMHESSPDIEIKQECGNEILMHEAEGIQMRDKYGNEVVLDAAAGFIRIASPSHNSVIELGKSTYTYTDSDSFKITRANSEEEVYGDTKKLHIGHTIEKFGGTKQSYSLAGTEEFFTGLKISQMAGLELKTNVSKEFSKNILSYEKRANKSIKFDSKEAIHLIGGAGKEGRMELNAYKVHLNSGGTSLRMNKDGDIIVVSKGKFTLHADGEITIKSPNKEIKIDGSKVLARKGEFATKNIKDTGP